MQGNIRPETRAKPRRKPLAFAAPPRKPNPAFAPPRGCPRRGKGIRQSRKSPPKRTFPRLNHLLPAIRVTAFIPAQEQDPRNQTYKQQGTDFEPRRYGLPMIQLVDKAYRHRHAPTERDKPQGCYDAAYDHKNLAERIENIRARNRHRRRRIRFAVRLCRAAASGAEPRRVIERLSALCTIFHCFLLFYLSDPFLPYSSGKQQRNGVQHISLPPFAVSLRCLQIADN